MTGFGPFDPSCPKAGDHVHAWSPPDPRLVKDDPRSCVHCGVRASEYLDQASAARVAFFSTLRQPRSCHGAVKK